MFNHSLSRRSFLTISAMTAATVALDWGKIAAYAAKMGPKSDYPTVIIGAGLGGLVCGAYLAKQGVPVTVVEQHSVPGGYATSFDRAGGKYTFEVSLHGTSINNNSSARILSEIDVLDKIDLVELPEVYRLNIFRQRPKASGGLSKKCSASPKRWTNFTAKRASFSNRFFHSSTVRCGTFAIKPWRI